MLKRSEVQGHAACSLLVLQSGMALKMTACHEVHVAVTTRCMLL